MTFKLPRNDLGGILQLDYATLKRRGLYSYVPSFTMLRLMVVNLFTSRPKCIPGSTDPGITIVNPTEISVMYGYIH